ncbi:MAG: hypothetical protein WD894_21190 [Pirellulales bacterium]
MYRARLETLENRTMFSANPLVDLSATLEAPPATAEYSSVDYSPAESLSFNDDYRGSLNIAEIKAEVIARTETVANDEKITIGGERTELKQDGLFTVDRDTNQDGTLAYRQTARATGLMALLVPAATSVPTGTVTFALAVDPSNPNVVYIGGNAFLTSDPQGPTYPASQVGTRSAEGSVPDVATEPSGIIIPGPDVSASLVSSDEYFARFADTTLEPAALAAEDKLGGFEIQDLMAKASTSSRIVTGVGAGGGPH